MTSETIVLASASPRRLELLRGLGFAVETIVSGYAEPAIPGLAARDLALRHAQEKLRDVLPRAGGRLTVAADTVVDLDGEALGKPRDAQEARTMLGRLAGREHSVHTGFALATQRGESVAEVSTTRVRFYPLDGAEIAAYVASAESLDKAGAYGIQGRAAVLVESIQGDFYTVMGFPVARFVRALRRLGLALPSAKDVSQPSRP